MEQLFDSNPSSKKNPSLNVVSVVEPGRCASSRRKCDTIPGEGGARLIGGRWNSKLLARCSSSLGSISPTTMAQVRRLRYRSLQTNRNIGTSSPPSMLMNIDPVARLKCRGAVLFACLHGEQHAKRGRISTDTAFNIYTCPYD